MDTSLYPAISLYLTLIWVHLDYRKFITNHNSTYLNYINKH